MNKTIVIAIAVVCGALSANADGRNATIST